MEENPENYEMRQRENYPEYDNMNTQELESRRDELLNSSDWQDLPDRDNRVTYIDDILDSQTAETSFIDNDDGKTVTITNSNSPKLNLPRVEFVDISTNRPQNEILSAVEEFIGRYNNIDNFRLSPHSDKAIELRSNLGRTKNNNITFRPLTTRNVRGNEQIVLKRDGQGVLHYNEANVAKEALKQFKKLIGETLAEQADRETQLIETDIDRPPILGLTLEENRELEGVLNPPNTMDPESRIGSNGALQIQANYLQEELNKTIDQMKDQEITTDEFIALADRANALEEARDRTLEQRELEEVREQQEEDVSRLQRFKEWAKENLVGLSAVAIAVAGIITTVIVSARGAIVKGAQATGKFAKALYNLGKKFGALLAPLFSILSTALSLAAKGLAWLASNLWVLAIAFTWFIYDQYKERRKKT